MGIKKENQTRNIRFLLTLLFWIYLALLLKITVFRENFSFSWRAENGKLNLELFKAYIPFLRGGFIGLFIYLFIGNIVWFIPLGAYLAWKYPQKGLFQAVAAGFTLSVCIEAAQYIFGVGVTELDDVVLNTFGTLIGAAAVRLMRKRKTKKRRDEYDRRSG